MKIRFLYTWLPYWGQNLAGLIFFFFFFEGTCPAGQVLSNTTIWSWTCICDQAVIVSKQLVRNRVGTIPPQVDVHNAQTQYLFTVSISNLDHTMRKYRDFVHFALHSVFVCCNLIDLKSAFAERHDLTTFIEENLLIRQGKSVTISTHPYHYS